MKLSIVWAWVIRFCWVVSRWSISTWRQAIAKAILAFYQKYHDEQSKRELKEVFLQYDKTLIVTDPRRCEPKKFGGKGARSRFQKSYR